MITRKQYMANEATFSEYYGEVVKSAGIKFNPKDPFISRVKKALASGDEHLNTIGLPTWDTKAASASASISRALKERGDFYSLAGGVCVMKEAARIAAMESVS